MTEHQLTWDYRVNDELRERAHCTCGYLMAGLDMSAVNDLYLRHLRNKYGDNAELLFRAETIHIDSSNNEDVERAEDLIRELAAAVALLARIEGER